MKLVEAIAAVAGGTIVAGGLGATAGWLLGRSAGAFVTWVASPLFNSLPPEFDPAEFGLGLGAVSGLVMGVGVSLTLALALILRDTLVTLATQRAQSGSSLSHDPVNGVGTGAVAKGQSGRDWN